MSDVVDKTTRSRMMAGIRGKNTKPELIVRRFLHARGFRYRLHYSRLPGQPDIIMPKHKVAIFVHGCFWHRHQGCRYTTNPEQNRDKWLEKFKQNIDRDKIQITKLIELNWRVIIIWECSLRSVEPDLSWLPNCIISGQHSLIEWPSPVGEKV